MPLVLTHSEAQTQISTKPQILIWDFPTESTCLIPLKDHPEYASKCCLFLPRNSEDALHLLPQSDVVLLDITRSDHNILRTIQEIISTIGICNLKPRVLCFSTAHRNPEFVLKVQRCGAQYVRVGSLEMLCEAVDLFLAEINELEHHGPHFEIVHRFSNGVCAPGEEVAQILLQHGNQFLQLPLGLVERLVFDLLAQRRLAVDSLQIVSSLAGDWFYREHAANSGHRQFKKVRRPTIKVSIQRIRDAMTALSSRFQLGFDPYRVLRSCAAVGTNRSLYKLCAHVSWRHPK